MPEYPPPPSHWQQAKMQRLAAERPEVERTDLKCPECGAPLRLRIGRYGRFYGCVRYKKNGCKGAISAKDNGEPAGIPAKARVRALRKQVMEALASKRVSFLFDGDDAPGPVDGIAAQLPEGGVGSWGEPECRKALKVLGVEPNIKRLPPPTRYERILDDDWLD